MAQDAANSSKEMEEQKKGKVSEGEKEEQEPVPVSRSSVTTIERISVTRRRFAGYTALCTPIAVAIGPYHRHSPTVQEIERVKRAALEEFCRAASQQCKAVHGKVLSLVGSARSCYDQQFFQHFDDEEFADMMFLDGWFLLQVMVSMCPDDLDASPEADLLMSKPEVHTRIKDIARDVLLVENQVPWLVLEALMELWPTVPVDSFLRLLASAFHVGNEDIIDNPTADLLLGHPQNHDHDQQPPPPHLFGLFYRRLVGAARRPRPRSRHVHRLSSISSTAVELAEMGVKLTARKTKMFGDMSMSKRRPGLGLSGELSLAPMVLQDLTNCWLINMAAYEACLGATNAENFAVSSYISVLALLMNREEDIQELRAKGIVHSSFSDKLTLDYFKGLAGGLQVGHRYYQVFEQLQEYKQDRWVWIAVHRFLYKNIRTIVAVLSVVGVLVGLFKTLLSLKQPQR